MKVITIGRSPENNDIVVNDEKVSRNHLQMVMDDNGQYSLVDLGSTNGTFVNGTRVTGEVFLIPGDQVMIGSTVLPWQSYFENASIPPQPQFYTPSAAPSGSPKSNRTWLYVLIGVLVLLIIGGVIGWKIYSHNNKEKANKVLIEEKEKAEDAKRKEAENARIDAVKASEEYEKALRKAAETQSEEDRAIAEEMRVKKESAEQLAQQKEVEWNQMRIEKDKALEDLKKAQENATKALNDAEKTKKEAQEDVEQAKAEAQAAKNEAKLIKQFYSLIVDLKPKDFQKICEKRRWSRGVDDAKTYVINRFDNAENNEKESIIKTIESLKNVWSDDAPSSLENEAGESPEIKVVPVPHGTPDISKEQTIDSIKS